MQPVSSYHSSILNCSFLIAISPIYPLPADSDGVVEAVNFLLCNILDTLWGFEAAKAVIPAFCSRFVTGTQDELNKNPVENLYKRLVIH